MIEPFWTIIIYPIIQIIEFVFVFTQKIFKETGISVLFVSGVVSVLCLPLYIVADSWQGRERIIQEKLKAGIDKIKAVFKHDEQYMMLSVFYRQHHYHPVYALRGTLGLLIQIPFFIAAYYYLSHLEALKGASFLFINDLGKPDALLTVGTYHINILPLIMTAINIVSGAIYTKGHPLKEKVQLYGMAGIFLVLLYTSPAGLVVYWTLNNVFSLCKNIYFAGRFKYKQFVVYACISAFCAFFAWYELVVFSSGDTLLQRLIAGVFIIIGLCPWCGHLLTRINPLPALDCSDKELSACFFIPVLILMSLTGLFIPASLIGASPSEFAYIDEYSTPLYFIVNTAGQAAGFFLFWAPCLYFIFDRRIKEKLSFLTVVLCAAALANTFLFPGHYGDITNQLIFVEGNPDSRSWEINNNYTVLAGICAVFILFFIVKRLRKVLLTALAFCAFSLLTLSIINIVSINNVYQKLRELRPSSLAAADDTPVEPIFNLSRTERNVVVIMLDMAMSVFIPTIFGENPELNDIYSGFVYYPNTLSYHSRTILAAPPIFGGYEYTPLAMNARSDVRMVEKHNESLLMMPRLFSDNNFEVVVTDPPDPDYSIREDLRIYDKYPAIKALVTDSVYTDYWIKKNNFPLPPHGEILKRDILWYSLFRISPLVLRPGIYRWGDWCAPFANSSIKNVLNGYAVLDLLPTLSAFSDSKPGSAVFLVNNTPHEPGFLQAPEYRPAVVVTNYGSGPYKKEEFYHTNAAAIKRLGDWFLYLKKENVYDNTRIIIVSDHGSRTLFLHEQAGLPHNAETYNPLLMIKNFNEDFNEDFNARGQMRTDTALMTTADVPFLATDGLVENPVNPFTGKQLSAENKEQSFYIARSGSIRHDQNESATIITLNPSEDYYVRGNIFNPANWIRADAYSLAK
jgi:YidC/Oxa1 family membrane protein insertase